MYRTVWMFVCWSTIWNENDFSLAIKVYWKFWMIRLCTKTQFHYFSFALIFMEAEGNRFKSVHDIVKVSCIAWWARVVPSIWQTSCILMVRSSLTNSDKSRIRFPVKLFADLPWMTEMRFSILLQKDARPIFNKLRGKSSLFSVDRSLSITFKSTTLVS